MAPPSHEMDEENSKMREWEGPLLRALREKNREKLKLHIQEAEAAIVKRQRTISSSAERHEAELLVLEDALKALRNLEQENLG